MPDHTFTVQEFSWHGRRAILNSPIECRCRVENDLYTFECKSLGIYSYDYGLRAAKDGMCEEFFMIWDNIAQSPEVALTLDARELKQQLLASVESVEYD